MTAYRSAYDHIVGLRLAETEDARTELTPLLPGLRAVARARLARIVAGAVGVGGALSTFVIAAWTHDQPSGLATHALVASSCALVVSWFFARTGLAAAARLLPVNMPELTLSGELEADLARIDAADPRAELQRLEHRARRLERPSVALPIAAVTLLFPLFSHWLFTQAIGSDNAQDFAQWIRISLIIVGHAHLALAVCGFLFARRLHGLSLEGLQRLRIHREWLKAWLITIGVSCLPGILLILVPPLLVAVTGIAFTPILWYLLHASIVGERSRFAFASAAAGVELESRARPAPVRALDGAASAGGGAPVVRLAEEQEREADRDDEHAGGDADDGAEREPLVALAHRAGDAGRGR